MGGVVVTVALVTAGAFEGGNPTNSPAARTATTNAITSVATHPAERLVTDGGSSVVAVRVAVTGVAAPSVASGVVITPERVLTIASLLPDVNTIGDTTPAVTVATIDGEVLRAEVVGIDPETDLALLILPGATLPAARLARGDGLTVGQSVLALGAAGGNHRWASRGVVAALDRLVGTPGGIAFAGLIETDVDMTNVAAGGALLNDRGELVGILSRIAPGHALPIGMASDVADQLATNGRAHHGWLGIVVSDAGDQTGGGARVEIVVPGSPAEAAGLVPGDVVSACGSDGVTDTADLMAAMLRRRPGDPVAIMVWRDGKKQRMEVSLGERPGSPPSGGAPAASLATG